MHQPKRPIRVLVVEDSTTARQLLVELLRSDGAFEVVGEADNGADAVEAALRLSPDLITMDVHMPVLDGLDATREIMRESPTPIVIVSSAFSSSDVDAALTATRAGALVVVPKPGESVVAGFRAHARRVPHDGQGDGRRPRRATLGRSESRPTNAAVSRRHTTCRPHQSPRGSWQSARPPGARPRFIKYSRTFRADFHLPVVIVQHMAHGFIQGLADWLTTNTGRRVVVANAGDVVAPGVAYIAPDDHHMSVSSSGRVVLADSSPLNGFRPSADHLFDGCSRAYGGSLVAVILTGMGQDGLAGLKTAHRAGSHIIAQDEASSIVFGMARAAITEGLVSEVLPLDAIGQRLGVIASRAGAQ